MVAGKGYGGRSHPSHQSYIDLYPQAYLEQLLSLSEPTLDQLVEGYLIHNATRNRALDLLPILVQIDPDRVHRIIDDPKIKARPAFHYRLPNCHIERIDWSLEIPWNSWSIVEWLSHQVQGLEELSAAYLNARRPVIGVNRATWVEFTDRWLKDHALV